MNKEEYITLEAITRLVKTLQNEINVREERIKILKAEISQLYDFINEVERLGEIENNRIDKAKELEGNNE
jgi:hypothetical protein